MILIFIFFIFIAIFNNICDGRVVLNAIAFSATGGSDLFTNIIDDFNEYALKNELDIYINLILIDDSNLTMTVENYEEMIMAIFLRGSKKYDIIFYDNIYTVEFSHYLIELNEILPEDHIKMYLEGVASQTCIHNGKLIGLPVFVDCNVIYYNEDYLNKYNKNVPKTWDEFIEVGSYILKEEHNRNNTDFIAYNGYFAEREGGFCSIYEFIYSFRNSVNSPFPKIRSEEAVNALKKMKEMKEKIASNDIFRSGKGFGMEKYFSDKSLFFKYWFVPNYISENKKAMHLPGVKEGISGSVIGGYNVAINKYSNVKKREEVIKAYTHITSKNMQIKIAREYLFFSPIPSVYDDKELCASIDCKFFKSAQFIARPTDLTDNYNSYSKSFRNNVYCYLYGKCKSPDEVLKNIDDLTRIYYLSIKTDDSFAGLIIFIITIIIMLMMILSLTLLYIKKFESNFKFLSKDYWFIFIFGLVFTLMNFFSEMTPVTIARCHVNVFILSFTYYMIFIPILHKLIVNFPEENKFSQWVNEHRYMFLMIFIVVDEFLASLLLIKPYKVEKYKFEDGITIEECNMKSSFGNFILKLLIVFRLFIIFVICLLIFLEWNILVLHKDIQVIAVAIYMDIVLLIVLGVTDNIKPKQYVSFYVIKELIYFFFILTNFIIIYLFRVIKKLIIKKNEEEEFKFYIKNELSKNKSGSASLSKSLNNNSSTNGSNTSVAAQTYKKFLGYHYKTSVSSYDINDNGDTSKLSIN